MLSIVGCACLGVLCAGAAVFLSSKVDPFISKLFYWLGIISLVAAMLMAATEESTSGWASAAILVLVLISVATGAETKRRGHL